MHVMNLADRPVDDIERVGRWIRREWHDEQAASALESRLVEFGGTLTHRGLPAIFVAVASDRVVGTASLVGCEVAVMRQYSPWLTSVHVAPEAYGQGVCASLIRHVEREAARLGFPRLYFLTEGDEEAFERLGWCCVDWTVIDGRLMKVLTHNLHPAERAA